MRLTLIVTTYNWPQALDLVLLAVSRQTRMPDEIIVADDGSAEPTRKVVRRWRQTFGARLHHQWQPDEGFRLARSRNRAIARAQGDYILLLDGDMVPHPRFVEDHFNAARPGAFIQGVRALSGEQCAADMLARRKTAIGPLARDVQRRRHLIRLPAAGRLMRWPRNHFRGIRGANQGYWREHLIAVNGFDERMTGWGYDDYEIAARLYHLGVQRFDLRFAGLAVHLWHPRRRPSPGNPSEAVFHETLATRATRCARGIEQLQEG